MTDVVIDKQAHLLTSAARDVLETMFFAIIEEEIPETPEQDFVHARVSFDGTWSGTLSLCLPASAARELAADFLAVADGEPSTEQIELVVGELVNMVCGTALSRLKSTGTFDLHPPEIVLAEDCTLEEGSISGVLGLQQGPLRISLHTHE